MPGRRARLSIRCAGAVATWVALAACGTTFVDETVATVDTSPDATTTTLPAVDPDAPLGELLAEIETLMLDLDQRIIDDDGDEATLDRVLQVWAAAEQQIRRNDSRELFNFQQGIELARTGVERLRPADASKGYRIFSESADVYADLYPDLAAG
ncbi:MAG: hypothetical protein HKN41_08305 [Ilumatobacter sp.]|nr:hypothetical protein [Ilumatobacter sp.]